MLSLTDWASLIENRIKHYSEVGSTNSVALSAADNDASTGTWIIADNQTSGKGRSGRSWISIDGNFHATLLLRNVQKPSQISELSIVSGVAFHQALSQICGHTSKVKLEIKWPNDILLNRCKLGGILIESSLNSKIQCADIVIGFGLNLCSHPETLDQPATNLLNFGFSIKPLEFLTMLDQTLYKWIAIWSEDNGLSHIRQEWLDRSLPVGTALITNGLKSSYNGSFVGINNKGHLLLHNSKDELVTITFGDVSIENRDIYLRELHKTI